MTGSPGTIRSGTFRTTIGRSGPWLPVLATTTLVGTATSLALPAALGGALDAVVADRDVPRWLVIVAGVICVGLICELVEVYADAAGVSVVASQTPPGRNQRSGKTVGAGGAPRTGETMIATPRPKKTSSAPESRLR